MSRPSAPRGRGARAGRSPPSRRPPQRRPALIERVLLVGLGGAIGSALRFLTSLAAAHWLGTEFPYGTLIVNLSGAFVIGLVQQIGSDALLIPDSARLFLTTGMMGGLTTYSAFSYETVRLMEANAWHQAWINVVVTTALALALCFLGIAVGRLILGFRG
jgi:CrcB protein